jgi:transposase
VVDVFHVVKLGFDALDEVRRRVQQEQTGHRGHRGDPLYATRRLLRRRVDRLQPRHFDKLNAALHAGDPNGEVAIAWHAAQALAGAMARTDRAAGAVAAEKIITNYIDCPVPEVARLARTLRTWRPQLLACFGPIRISNGPTEAINGRLEHLRGSALGFRNLTNYIARSLLETGGFRPCLHPRM